VQRLTAMGLIAAGTALISAGFVTAARRYDVALRVDAIPRLPLDVGCAFPAR
jgi:hypothetical protein